MIRDEIIEIFLENARNAAAEAMWADGVKAMNRALAEMIGAGGTVYCPGVTETEQAVVIPPERRAEDFFNASVCVEEVFGAIAETGSLVCTSRGGKAVQAGLLPSHHVALVPRDNVYETLNDFFGSWGDAPPTNITLETGPSRTADIEMTLTIGVHGPERLSIIVIDYI